MRRFLAFAAAALCACSGHIETFSVSPDQKHVLIGRRDSVGSVDVDTMAEVGHASDVYAGSETFSANGSVAVLRGRHGTLVALPTAGGTAVDLGPSVDFGKISPDGSRVAFLRATCPGDMQSGCSELYAVPSSGGEPVRVGSGIRVSISNDPALIVPASLTDRYEFAGNDTLLFTTFEGGLTWAPPDGSAPPALLAPGTPSPFPFLPPIAPIFWPLRDGRAVVQDGTGLVLLDPRGSTAVRLVEGGSTSLICPTPVGGTTDFSCGLSSAGTLASYFWNGSTWTVQTIALTGGAPFTVTAASYSVFFDRDGGLVFFDPDGFLNVASPSGQIRQIGQPAIEGYSSATSPDGRWVSFLKQRLNSGPCVNCDTLHLLSTQTAATWTLKAGGNEIFILGHAFSPDSTSILFLTHDRQLGLVPIAGGEPRLLQSDVDAAAWAGPDHVVRSRTRSSPAGVEILRVR